MEMSACTGSFKKLLQGRSNMRDGVSVCVDPRGAAGVCVLLLAQVTILRC